MKILFIDKIFLPFIGGAEVVVYEVAKKLIGKGHEVHILTGRIKDEPLYEEIEGMRIHRIRMPVSAGSESLGRPIFVLWSILPLMDLTRRIGFDIIVENIAPNPSLAPLVARARGIPCVGIIHDIPDWGALGYPFWISLPNSLQISAFLKLMPYQGFAAVADASLAKLRRITGKGSQVVIHNGADPEVYGRAGSGGKSREPTIIYIGRFSKNKRIDWLLESISRLKEARLLIVGTGTKKLEDAHRRKSAELGLEGRVSFMGKVAQETKAELLKKSHILALPSTTEGCPLILLEAMASGVPFVASDVGGIPELADGTGLLVHGDDFSQAFEKLLKDSALRDEMGRRGMELVRIRFNWTVAADAYEDFFEKIIRNSSASG